MASARSIKAGSAFVELFLRDNRIRQGLTTVSRHLSSAGSQIVSFGTRLTAAAAGASAPFAFAIKAASDMEETMNKFNVVFGENSAEVQSWGERFGSTVGRSKQQIADFLAGTQDLLVPIGFDSGAAIEMSKQLTGLAVDLASFNNMADDDALRDLHAALTGSGEVMKKYGVIVSEAAVKQELMQKAIDPTTATEQEKVMARLSIIMRGTTAAQGDAIRSAGSFANQMKSLRASISDVAVQIGSALLPVVTPIVQKLSSAVRFTETWVSANKELVATVAKVLVGVAAAGAALVVFGGGVVALGAVLGSTASLMGALGTAVSAVGAGLAFMVSPAGLAIGAIVGVGAAILKVTGAGAAGIEFLKGAFITLRDDALRAFGGISDALAAGNIRQAAEILWLTLKLEWQRGISFLNSQWQEWKSFFLSVINEATFSAAAFFTDAWAGIQTTWLETVDVLRNGWELFTSSVQRTWATAQNFISKGILQLMSLLDDTVDVAAASAVLDQDLNAANQRRDQQRDQAIYQRELQRQQRLDQIERDRLSARSVLEQQRLAEQSAIYDRQNQALEDSQRDLDEARAKWNAALEAAAGAREQAEAGGSGDSGVAAKVRDLLDTVSGAASVRLAAIGGPTFSGRAAEQIFGSGNATDLARRTLDVAKQQLDEQKKIRQATENNKPVWGP